MFDDLTDKHRKKLKTSFTKDDFFKTNYFVICDCKFYFAQDWHSRRDVII